MDQTQSQLQSSTTNTGITGNSPSSDSKRAGIIIALVIILVIAFACIGYLTSRCQNSCDKKCPDASSYVCPEGFTIGCDTCTGKNYCGENQCTSATDCQNSPYAKSQGRTVCVTPPGSPAGTTGYCHQCSDATNCPKGYKCVRGWCTQCTKDSDCAVGTWNNNAVGKCIQNACTFTATQCNSPGTLQPVSNNSTIWPYNKTKGPYSTLNTCTPAAVAP